MNRYTLGNTVRLRATMLDDKDAKLDMGTLRCAVTPPGTATPIEVAVVTDGTRGVAADFVPTVVGVHRYAFTNAIPRANGEAEFTVVARRVAALT